MTPEHIAARAGRVLLHSSIVALGLAAIVGSGGGFIGFPDLSCLNTPQGCGSTPPLLFFADLTPQRPILQVGMPVKFDVSTNVISPTYQWCRRAKGAGACTQITGANGPSYSLAAVNLADDGADFQVTVKGGNGEVLAVADTVLAVSAMPAVILMESEFNELDWSVATVANPPLPGLSLSANRFGSGGNPGAYQRLIVDLPLEVRIVNLFNVKAAVVYDPATQGAIYLIEFSLDCNNLATASFPTYSQYWLPTIEQGGRRFLPDANAAATCLSPGWSTRSWSGFNAAAFKLFDGPACGVGEACPDFSSQGAPMRMGMSYRMELRSPLPTAGAASSPHFDQGLDNFKATVWRH